MKSMKSKDIINNNCPFHKRSLSNFEDDFNFSLDDFYSQCKKMYNGESIEKILNKSLSNAQNLLGEGKEGDVFQIEKIPKYVIKIPKKYSFQKIKGNFTKIKDNFPSNNFGQAIASNTDNIQILKRVYGHAHGPLMGKISRQQNKLIYEDAKMALNQMIEISKFPLKSYIDFAEQIKIINQHSVFCIDMLNSNNLMVDLKNKKFQLIDLFNRNKIPLLEDFSGDIHCMINLLLCAIDHSEIYHLLNDCERKELKSAVIDVVYKCKISSIIVDLSVSKLSPEDVYDRVIDFYMFKNGIKEKDKSFSLSDKYKEFKDLYPNIIPDHKKKNKTFNQKIFFKELKSRLVLCDILQPFYLIYLYDKKKLSHNDIIEIISIIPKKIPQKDLQYFCKKKLLLN